jgi:N-glycosylase/DNA lyase
MRLSGDRPAELGREDAVCTIYCNVKNFVFARRSIFETLATYQMEHDGFSAWNLFEKPLSPSFS